MKKIDNFAYFSTMLKRTHIFTLILLLVVANATAGIKEVYLLRVQGNDYLQAKKYDSAAQCFAAVIRDPVFANATDYLNLSHCSLQLGDTVGFKQHLIYSIEKGGADSTIMRIYFRSLDSNKRAYLKDVLSSVLPKYRAIFLKTIDPYIEKELDDMMYLDQICRRQADMDYTQQLFKKGDTTNVNLKHITAIGRYIDSVNYVRVVDLIKHKRYPGFHSFGINSSNYSPLLMHISDHSEEQWEYIFNFLKQEVASGDIMANEVLSIATRHYRKMNCTYYGTIKWGLSTPCDCEHVDKFRAEIGLDSLKEEYQRLKQQLPDCYHE